VFKLSQRKDSRKVKGGMGMDEMRPCVAAKQPITIKVLSSLVVETGKEDDGDISEATIRWKHKVAGPLPGK